MLRGLSGRTMGIASDARVNTPPGEHYASYTDGTKPDAYAVESAIDRLNKKVKWLAVRPGERFRRFCAGLRKALHMVGRGGAACKPALTECIRVCCGWL